MLNEAISFQNLIVSQQIGAVLLKGINIQNLIISQQIGSVYTHTILRFDPNTFHQLKNKE